MPKCPNCGQRTKGDFCQWCGYPIMKGDSAAKKAEKEAKEREKREADEARKAKEAARKAEREAKQAAKEREKREADEAGKASLSDGLTELTIAPPVDLGQVRKLVECLSHVQDLRIVLIGGSPDEGIKIVVSTGKPVLLVGALREMPPVEQVVKKGKEKIEIMLEAE